MGWFNFRKSKEKKNQGGADFPFEDSPNVATITCCHILKDGAPILHVSHDEDDGMWQFLCGQDHETSEARVVSLESIFEIDSSVGKLAGMPCGCVADRKSITDDWVITYEINQ